MFLPGKSYGQRSLAGYSPWGRKSWTQLSDSTTTTYNSNFMLFTSEHVDLYSLKVKVLVTQLYLTLCNPMDCNLPGSSIQGIFQARTLEWVAFPSPWDLPKPRIKPRSPALQADSLPSEPPGKFMQELTDCSSKSFMVSGL